MTLNHNFEAQVAEEESSSTGNTSVLDPVLYQMLKDLRREIARERKIPPFVIFQDPSLADMSIQYPITTEEMANITGVSKGKALRYGRRFRKLIKIYVEEHEIIRPQDFVVKSVVNKSGQKVAIIQSIDRKIPLEDIGRSNNLKHEELLHEIEMIVASGTKLNLDYYIRDNVDEYAQEEIHDYFMEAENDSVDEAYKVLKEEDITLEEIQLMRIKFLSDLGN